MFFPKVALALGLVLPAFAGRIVFTFSPSNLDSSLTLAGAAAASAIGNSGVLSLINEGNSAVFLISGGNFTFTTGGRTDTPGTGVASLNAGGNWSITGSVTNGAQTATGVLVSGSFLSDASVIYLVGRNTLSSSIDVDFVNPILMTILGINGYVDGTDRVNLTRPGTFNSTTGAYANSAGAGTTNGSLAFLATSDVPEPTTTALLGVSLAGGMIVFVSRRRVKNSRGAL